MYNIFYHTSLYCLYKFSSNQLSNNLYSLILTSLHSTSNNTIILTLLTIIIAHTLFKIYSQFIHIYYNKLSFSLIGFIIVYNRSKFKLFKYLIYPIFSIHGFGFFFSLTIRINSFLAVSKRSDYL